jgi:5-methylcytosine-specific restriction protein B
LPCGGSPSRGARRGRGRPQLSEAGFRLTAGPLRELADLASREGNRHTPHFLIIDEINRANLAKVFGELYFLLEYRNKSVRRCHVVGCVGV